MTVCRISGLRGAVAFALVLHLQLEDEKRHVLITSTLIIVLFTLLCLGGSTLPLMKVNVLVPLCCCCCFAWFCCFCFCFRSYFESRLNQIPAVQNQTRVRC